MPTMLIVKAVLLLGIASESTLAAVSSSVPSDDSVIFASTRSKRELVPPPASIVWSAKPKNPHGKRYVVPYSASSASYEDTSQSRTTANTIAGPRSSQGGTYNPYRFSDENIQNQNARADGPPREEAVQVTSAIPSLQGGFHASPEDGYAKNAQSNQHFRNQAANGANQNSQYFANPSTYRHIPETGKDAPSIRKNSDSPADGISQLPKLQSFQSVLTNRQYPSAFRDNSFENFPKFPKFRGPSALTFGTQSPLANPSQGSPFRSATFSPTFSSGLSSSPGFKAFDKLAQNYLYGNAPAVGYNNNKPPLPVAVQNGGAAAPGFVRAFDGQSGLLGTGNTFQARPSSGLTFDFSKAGPTSLTGGSGPFSSIGNSQFLPVRSALGAPQIGQFKGTGLDAFASNEYAKPGVGYELLANQPQLHFTTSAPPVLDDDRQSAIYHTKPFEEIRTDVEVIDKKKPTTTRPDYSDEHDFDEDSKTAGDFDYSPDDADSRPQKSPDRDASYEVPSSNLFNSYDEAFGKYSKLASREENANGPRPAGHHSSKPVYQSHEENDDGTGDRSSEDYRSGYTEAEAASYEDEDSQESRRSERQESDDPSSGAREDDEETEPYKRYGEDYEKEFEDSYRKELPKNDYTHVKEVPDIEEPSESKKRSSSRNRSKSSRGGSKQKSRHVVRDGAEEPKEYESYKSHRYAERPKSSQRGGGRSKGGFRDSGKAKTSYKDNEGHGSSTSWRSAIDTETPVTESFGYKIPRDRGTSRYRNDNVESGTTNQQTKSRKPHHKFQGRFEKSSRLSPSTQKPLTLTLPAFESVETQTALPNDGQKPEKKFFGGGDSFGAFSNPVGLRFFGKSPIGRGFSGI